METNNPQSVGCMKSLWQSLESPLQSTLETSSSAFMSSVESSTDSVNLMIANRGGFSKIVGLLIVPSQFLGPDLATCEQIIGSACQSNLSRGYTVESIQFRNKTNVLKGVICYPSGWNLKDRSRCVVYHNPNGITIAGFFEENKLSWTAGEILKLKKCPLILYDYRGTGLNSGDSYSTRFCPTSKTIVEDGVTVLNYALEHFQNVDVWGTSLGGAVATVSLERYLSKNPDDVKRVRIANHDSFTNAPRVIFPTYPWIADTLGWMVGGNLDAQTPMGSLIERGVEVFVFYQKYDFVIPKGVKMAKFVSQKKDRGNVHLICAKTYGHGNIYPEMLSDAGF